MADEPKLPELQKKIDDLSNKAKSPQTTSKEDQEKSTAEALSLSAQMQGLLQKSEYGLMTGFSSGLAQAGIVAAAEKLTQAAGSIPGASVAGSQLGQMMKGYRERRRQGGSGGIDAGSGGGVGGYSGGGGGGGDDETGGQVTYGGQRVKTSAGKTVITTPGDEWLASRFRGTVGDPYGGGRAEGYKTGASDIKLNYNIRGMSPELRYALYQAGQAWEKENPGKKFSFNSGYRSPLGSGSSMASAKGSYHGGHGAGPGHGEAFDVGGASEAGLSADAKSFREFATRHPEYGLSPKGQHFRDAGHMEYSGSRGGQWGTWSPGQRQQFQKGFSEWQGAKYAPGRPEGGGGSGGEGGGRLRQSSHDVKAAINEAAAKYNLNPAMMHAMADIESAGNPNSNRNKSTQYKGLFQMGTRGAGSEWARYGEGKDPYNARDNAMAAARSITANINSYKQHFGREPTPGQLYLMHQQGFGFYTRGAMTNISGNLPAGAPAWARTHDGFEKYWSQQLEKRISGPISTRPPQGGTTRKEEPKQAPQETKPGEPRHIWPGEKPYGGPQKPLDATPETKPSPSDHSQEKGWEYSKEHKGGDAERISSEKAFGGPETSVVKTKAEMKGGYGLGTGFSIGGGYFMTARHNIGDAEHISLTYGKETADAKVIHKNAALDYAILKLPPETASRFEASGMTSMQLSSETPQKGDTLTAHGFPGDSRAPGGQGGFTSTPGQYSSLVEGGLLQIGKGTKLAPVYDIATSKDPKTGVSGGPITDKEGRATGLLTGVEASPGKRMSMSSPPMAAILKDIPEGTIPQHILDAATAKHREQQQMAAPAQAAPAEGAQGPYGGPQQQMAPQAPTEGARKQWPGEREYKGPQKGLEAAPSVAEGADGKPARGQPSQTGADGKRAPQAIRAAEQARGGRMHIPGKSLANIDPELRGRIEAAYRAAPASAKAGFQIISARRSTELQAQLYARYKAGKGGIAARPGYSKHEQGLAVDIRDPSGWFHKHGREFGIYPPMGKKDWPHMQKDPSWHGQTATPTDYKPDARAQEVKRNALKEKADARPGQKSPEPRQPQKQPQQRQHPYHHHPHQNREGDNWASRNHASPAAAGHSHVRESYNKRDQPQNHKFGDTA